MRLILFYAASSAGEAEVSPKGMRIILFYAASSAGEAEDCLKRQKSIFEMFIKITHGRLILQVSKAVQVGIWSQIEGE